MQIIKHLLVFAFVFHNCIVSAAIVVEHDSITSFNIPKNTQQVIVVTTTSWTTREGNLQRYEKVKDKWVKVGTEAMVAIGKNGLAWGKGLHTNISVEKKEGDGKAPAGVFPLGTMFGYGEKSPSADYPYRQSTARDYFVDDVNALEYNQWVTIPVDKQNNPGDLWSSYEKMKRADHIYEYGIVILHNSRPIEKGKGSAIFFHVWRNPGAPTLGCTSMSKENLLELMRWLDPKKNPLLIQVPESELKKLK